MKEKLQGILQTAKEQLAAAKDSRALDEARVKFLEAAATASSSAASHVCNLFPVFFRIGNTSPCR